MQNPKWTIKSSEDLKFYFTLQAANGEVLLTSEMYETKQNAFKGIMAILKVASTAPVHDMTDEGPKEEPEEYDPNQD